MSQVFLSLSAFSASFVGQTKPKILRVVLVHVTRYTYLEAAATLRDIARVPAEGGDDHGAPTNLQRPESTNKGRRYYFKSRQICVKPNGIYVYDDLFM